jgi:hypothetical protein
MLIEEYLFRLVIVIEYKQVFELEQHPVEVEHDLIVLDFLIENLIDMVVMDHLDLNMVEDDFDELLMLFVFLFFRLLPNFHHELNKEHDDLNLEYKTNRGAQVHLSFGTDELFQKVCSTN